MPKTEELAKGQMIWVRGKVKKVRSGSRKSVGQTEKRRIHVNEILDVADVA